MIKIFADLLVYKLIGIDSQTKIGEALDFFVYDTVKIFLMLIVIIFIVSIIKSFFPPERTKKFIGENKNGFVGNVLAAMLGILTPFCSCSAIPMFIGFIESGIPLGVTFSFLISSPMVNEVALIVLWASFGWKVALIYISTGVFVAIVTGIIIGKLKLEKYVEDYVYKVKVGNVKTENLTCKQRITNAVDSVKEILGKTWIFVIIGIGLGSLMHGYAPTGILTKYAGRGNCLAVIVAVVIGIPLYSNAAGIIPVIKELDNMGMAMGTILAFMMSVTALSLPEIIILRKVLKPKLLAIFIGIMTLTIIFIGYLFNLIL